MEAKTAELIVEIYRHIQSLKNVLKTPPFIHSELLIQSGNALDALMNQALAMTTNELVIQKISELQKYIEEFLQINSTLISTDFQDVLQTLLTTLLQELTQLKNQL